ncbi:GTP cyclohydrolase I FolE [Aquirhabdus parva]|uniref:GTP cyclohydrolase 1 n=1 Tax=Aquirhabdus parva TaxID=2283318 RepID=A0A345P510_9GAMM|nr:GTP cyclohydrolase I FolE [Aquirhabdus parva]AXI02369.1 GTP cyclohydrolase I FolE [Aquirhabdus parva]
MTLPLRQPSVHLYAGNQTAEELLAEQELAEQQGAESTQESTLLALQQSYATLISGVGEDLTRPGLVDTPIRAAKALSFLTKGYAQTLEDVTNGAIFPSNNHEMVMVKGIEFFSMCEHHLLPFMGHTHVAYLPEGKVLGLSKMARIVDMYARRLQIQENLTQEIAQAVMDATGARGVAVVMDAQHMCMMMRGVQKQDSSTRSVAMIGQFTTDNQARNEFLRALPASRF